MTNSEYRLWADLESLSERCSLNMTLVSKR